MKIQGYAYLLIFVIVGSFSSPAISRERLRSSPQTPTTTINHPQSFERLNVRPETYQLLKNLLLTVSKDGPSQTAIFTGSDHKRKLAAAEAMASELKRPLIKINVKKIVSQYIGETEKNIDGLFRRAKTQGAVLLFDEADALFGKRTKVSDAHDRYANQEVSYLLKHIKRYPGVIIVNTQDLSRIRQAPLSKNQSIISFSCKPPKVCAPN